MMRLQEKVAIITGGANGIGAATAKKFVEEGAKVVIVDLNEEVMRESCETLNQISPNSTTSFKADVTDRAAIEALIDYTHQKYGKIDILINNAGITLDAQLVKMTEDQWDKVIDVDLKGVFNVGQLAAQYMKEQGSGVILNASSIVGLYGNFGQTNYAASKWGVIGMTKTWARELGKYGIRVNAVAPGFTKTDMIATVPEKVLDSIKSKSPLNELGEPIDIANGYTFLASDEAKYITGFVLSIDGGMTL